MSEETVKLKDSMIKEIFEQPEVVRNILNEHVDIKTGEVVFKEFKGRVNALKNYDRVIFLGCGTSFYAAQIGNYIFEEISGLPCEAEIADEFVVREHIVENRTLIIVLSQSGETGDILRAVKQARKKDVFVIGLTNNKNSSLKKYVDVLIDLEAKEEKAMAATKSFVAQLSILALLSIFVGRQHNMSPASAAIITQEIRLIPDKISKVLKLNEEIKKTAEDVFRQKSIIFLGRKYNFPLAQEAAHKFKETTYIHCEGASSEEFIHGPNAIIESGYTVVFIIPEDSVYDKNVKVLKKLKKQGADIIVLTTKGNKKLRKIAKHIFYVFPVTEVLMPIVSIVPFQLMAYHTAILKGINVDKPRNISKYIK